MVCSIIINIILFLIFFVFFSLRYAEVSPQYIDELLQKYLPAFETNLSDSFESLEFIESEIASYSQDSSF